MSNELNQLGDMVGARLANEQDLTAEGIRGIISQVRQLPWFSGVDDAAAEGLARKLEERLGIVMTIGAQLTTPDFQPWLPERKVSIDPYYWDRYRKLLIQKGFAPNVIAATDEVTDRIVGLLEDPAKTGAWKRRGMVVGHVQSGKTANYTGVICKAADAGYRLVIVIAGIHNNLRNQTQMRIDEGFVGRDTAKSMRANATDGFIGVSRFDARRRPASFTNSLKDFSKAAASFAGVQLDDLKEPAVLVIKKNSSTLRNVIEWLKEHNAKRGTKTIHAPMLLIDDEADNASINTASDKGAITRINGQIRELLSSFERSCYVGYTATPFANIFIDPDSDDAMLGEDLFPRDFIISLDPPTNYFGATRIFIERSPDIIRYIEDNEDLLPLKHDKQHEIAGLPASLMTAIHGFVIGRAIRILRGQQEEHASMLVNASRFTDVQEKLKNEIIARLREIQAGVRVNGARPVAQALDDPHIRALHDTWEADFRTEWPDWGSLQLALNDAAAPIQVVTVNSRSSGSLNYGDYGKGLAVIAVGGYSLSRGLTLEGLMVSYFLRNSMMYDTLMQMGRWFGYRGGYEDLCRLWMPEEADGWYTRIAAAIEELRDELRIMEARKATPDQFGLKVRSDPETLIVTARNKMGSSTKFTMRIGLAKNFIETAILRGDASALKGNRLAAFQLAKSIDVTTVPHEKTNSGRLYENVPAEAVLDFIRAFQNHEGSMLTQPGPVLSYIGDRADDELSNWQVLFAAVREKAGDIAITTELGFSLARQHRTAGLRSNSSSIFVSDKQRVASRGVERIGVPEDAAKQAEDSYKPKKPTEGSINYPDRIYRYVRKTPLLIVHLLKIDGNRNPDVKSKKPAGNFDGIDDTVVAYSVSFPDTATPEKTVEYVVNTTWMRENMGGDEEDDEPRDDDNQ